MGVNHPWQKQRLDNPSNPSAIAGQEKAAGKWSGLQRESVMVTTMQESEISGNIGWYIM